MTYPGAFHHVMNRGIGGESIFLDDSDKKVFLEILSLKAKLMGIRIIGYCLMKNHFHLVLENCLGRMSGFLKQVNGSYGIYYRLKHGGKGYVFQNRFKSTLIQDDFYLKLALLYLLQNPVRAGLTQSVSEYQWSSAGEYMGLSKTAHPISDVSFVRELWGGEQSLLKEIMGAKLEKLPMKKCDHGEFLGEFEFLGKALEKRERRIVENSYEKRRIEDSCIEPVEKVYFELERKNGIKFKHLDYRRLSAKKLRGELLVRLKELSGLTYREIIQFPEFSDIKLYSLAKLYKDARIRISIKKAEVTKSSTVPIDPPIDPLIDIKERSE